MKKGCGFSGFRHFGKKNVFSGQIWVDFCQFLGSNLGGSRRGYFEVLRGVISGSSGFVRFGVRFVRFGGPRGSDFVDLGGPRESARDTKKCPMQILPRLWDLKEAKFGQFLSDLRREAWSVHVSS